MVFVCGVAMRQSVTRRWCGVAEFGLVTGDGCSATCAYIAEGFTDAAYSIRSLEGNKVETRERTFQEIRLLHGYE